MQSWRRRKSLWLALSASWLLLVLLGGFSLLRLALPPRPRPGAPQGWPRWLDAELLQSFSQAGELPEDAASPQAPHGGSCNWGACFDTSKCRGDGLKVFVYPASGPISETHHRILASIEGSRFHTFSPAGACLLLLLSLDAQTGECSSMPLQWNRGRNHLVLRLHPAPCPKTFQLGQAMVAEASPTVDSFRPGFDVALPFLPEAHPLRGGAPGQLQQHSPQPGIALLALEEERGGWRTADTGSSACPWDARCEQDPGPGQTQRGETLPNATFCLISGHRPEAASRFLQALQAGCIPVLLSPRWELPFSEVIDWTKAAIVADERLPLQVLAALQEMSPARVLALRQQTQFLWDAYFSSVEKVIHTTLELLSHFRLFRTGSLEHQLTPHCCGTAPQGHSWPCLLFPQAPRTSPSTTCNRILVLWSNERPLPSSWPETAMPLTVIDGHRKVSDRFFPYSTIRTDAILSLDARSSLSTSEVDFAFVVWQSFPERMVGFLTSSHFWDEAHGGWGYTAERTNEFSMVLTTAAFYHRYYHTLFTHSLPKALRTLADEAPTCVDVLMNFLVAAVTKLPPIKVPYGKQRQEAAPLASGGPGPRPKPQAPAPDCVNQIAAAFGHMPLLSSCLRLDPVLFKDPVSVQRKKYRSLEKP
ncbi:exostosin-like 1 isoform X2 [Macaca fascicularis]|uniref:exostosin-like 1 isoform X2 n=1 Tax=Macaca fascicularis TaxID=9541 RepID=UPI0032B071C8